MMGYERWWRLGTDYGVLFSIKTNWATFLVSRPPELSKNIVFLGSALRIAA